MHISKISFKGDDEIFKKPDLKSTDWVNSKLDDWTGYTILQKSLMMDALGDTFKRINDDNRLQETISATTERTGDVERVDISDTTR